MLTVYRRHTPLRSRNGKTNSTPPCALRGHLSFGGQPFAEDYSIGGFAKGSSQGFWVVGICGQTRHRFITKIKAHFGLEHL